MAAQSKYLYLIALVPPQEILDDVLQIKNEFKLRYGASHALKLPGHITLQMPFWVQENNYISLKNHLDELSKKQHAFPITLDGFDSFPPRVIFIKITPHDAIVQLQLALQDALPITLFEYPKQRQTEIHPHLTVATRDLQKNIFPQAWSDFKNRAYQASFIAKELILFRHTGKVWLKEAVFQFGN